MLYNVDAPFDAIFSGNGDEIEFYEDDVIEVTDKASDGFTFIYEGDEYKAKISPDVVLTPLESEEVNNAKSVENYTPVPNMTPLSRKHLLL